MADVTYDYAFTILLERMADVTNMSDHESNQNDLVTT